MLTIKNLGRKYIEYIIGAFTLVIGLAWNSAFQNYFEKNDKLNKQKYGRWIYAISITLLLIIIITILNYFTSYL